MLRSLSIRDIVLIDRLDFSFRKGLCVLTGETGAGKSILLDALGLTLGARAVTGMVRHGARQAVVGAEFDIARNHPARRLLASRVGGGSDFTHHVVEVGLKPVAILTRETIDAAHRTVPPHMKPGFVGRIKLLVTIVP
ncbi:MAG: AAA family ATPase [Proteobacteria bacterium]|nr:AAA family ATPase [Pseudomonadota bacterium]